MMKAAVYENYGPPEIVQIKEISKPSIKDNEVLIKVHASTVNRTDCGFRSAEYFIVRFFAGLFKPKQKVLGNEFAGIVEAIGNSVENFKVGDKVFGYNDQQFGAHAQYMKMDSNAAIALKPKAYNFVEAAPFIRGLALRLG